VKIGYIGLGALGSEIARRFLDAHELWVWDLNVDAVARLGRAGARMAESASEVGREADVILTCLPRSADVRRLLFEEGLASALAPGKLVIDQTSGDPKETREIAQRLGRLGVVFLDAAVSGSPHVIPQGLAVILASGPNEAIERADPVLRAISETVFRCGARVGDGQAMKMINNAMNAGCRMCTLEVAALARKSGLSLECITEVLNRGGGANLTTERMLPAIAQGKSATNFALSLMLKDLNQAVALSMEVGVPAPVGSAVRSLLQIGANTLGPRAPLEGMIGVVESMAGTHLGRSETTALTATVPFATAAFTDIVNVVGTGAVTGSLVKRFRQTGMLHSHKTTIEPNAAPRAADLIALCFPTHLATREALMVGHLSGKGLPPGTIVMYMTRGDSEEVRRTATELSRFGVILVEAALIGTAADIEAGTSLILTGGPSEACQRVHSVLAQLASRVIHCGDVGSAQTARVVDAAVAALCRQVTHEGVAAGLKFGLRLHDMAEILTRCSGWSAAGRAMFPELTSRRAVRGETLREVCTDLQRSAALAIRQGVPTTLLNIVRSLVEAAVISLGDDADASDMFKLARDD